MVGMGETYIAAFVLALGYGHISAGLVSVLPVAIGSFFQFLIMFFPPILKSYKAWVVVCGTTQALTLFVLSALSLLEIHSMTLIILITSIYWAAGLSAGPAWNAWMGTFIPQKLRISYFSTRARLSQAFIFIGILIAGFSLYYGEIYLGQNKLTIIFGLLFLASGLFRSLSTHHIKQQEESRKGLAESAIKTELSFLLKLFDKNLLPIMVYIFIIQAAIQISAPYFNPYMLEVLDLNYIEYMFLMSMTFISRVVLFPVINYLARNVGVPSLIWTGTILMCFIPFLWTLSDNFTYLILLQVLAGFSWGAQEMGVFFLLLDRFPAQERSHVLTTVNFLNSLAMFMGVFIGAYLINEHGISKSAYHFIFAVSTASRFLALLLIPFFVHKTPSSKFQYIFRVVGLRPHIGAVARPILYVAKKSKDYYKKSKGVQHGKH